MSLREVHPGRGNVRVVLRAGLHSHRQVRGSAFKICTAAQNKKQCTDTVSVTPPAH